MKIKLLSAIFAGLCSFALFADVQLSNEQAAEHLKTAKEAQSSYLKFSYTRAARIGTMNITSFAQVIDANNEIAKEAGFDNKQLIDEGAIVLGLWWWDSQFRTEALKMAIQTKNKQQYYAVLAFEKIVNTLISPAERFAIIKEGLENKQFKSERIVHAVEKMCEIGEKIEKQDELKTTLQKLNRIYTPMLAKDKANYEKVVAYIRLALNAY